MFESPKTGESHTANKPMWFFLIMAGIAFIAGFLNKLTGVSSEVTWANDGFISCGGGSKWMGYEF